MPILHITAFWCRDAEPRHTRAVVSYCRSLAATVGFDFEVLPHGDKDPNFVLPYDGEIFTGLERAQNSSEQLHDLIDARVRDKCGIFSSIPRVIVIFGKLGGLPIAGGGYQQVQGRTIQADESRGERPRLYQPYCVIDSVGTATRGPWSLLHEIAHAAGAIHTSSDNHDLMYDGRQNKVEPIVVSQAVVSAFNTAFFSSQA